MSTIIYRAMPTADSEAFWSGAPDANGQRPEVAISDGDGVPCRHCLTDIAAGERHFVLAYRPFPSLQPYAETGPILLHASPCRRAADAGSIPAMLARRKAHLVKGYNSRDRIHGTGQIVQSAELDETAHMLLQQPEVAYLHVRSAANNCCTCRIDRV
jgi:hypothetical protein